MKSRLIGVFIALVSVAVGSVSWAQVEPSPTSFQFSFCSDDNLTTAAGFITFDANQMTNPFSGISYDAVLDLQVTVAGASSGNGTFTRDDFSEIYWDSNGGTMDFGTELVGQPTSDWDWGTSLSDGQAGDFNIFTSFNTAGAPNGNYFFLLGADEGQAENMSLRTFAPGPAEIPAPSCPDALTPPVMGIPALNRWGSTLLMLALLGMAALGYRRLRV